MVKIRFQVVILLKRSLLASSLGERWVVVADPVKQLSKLASVVQAKAGEVSAIAADGLGKAARGVNDAAAVAKDYAGEAVTAGVQKIQTSIYRPVFADDCDLPKMIVIADDEQRKDIEVCQGAIGWSSKEAGLEVLHLYEEVVIGNREIVFYPQPQLDAVYYQDSLNSRRYINLECYFDTLQKDKFTELKRIAYELGAKSCTLESFEETKAVRIVKAGASAKSKGEKKAEGEKSKMLSTSVGVDVNGSVDAAHRTENKVVFKQVFEGDREPRRPKLEWFANDKEIEFLVETRCNNRGGKTKQYSMQLDSMLMQTMNAKTAVRIDKALAKLGASCNFSLEGEALTEQRRKLKFEIEF